MVKSRYLCSAPRPETWDERAEALLKSLGGSATQQETMLRETLDSLKVMHADKQKTGPGRKSNAEHAIAFYEYVLETITENKEGATQQDDDDDDDAPEESDVPAAAAAVPDLPVVKRKRGRPRKNPLPADQPPPPAKQKNRIVIDTTDTVVPQGPLKQERRSSHQSNDSNDHSVSIASMDTQEFINQHNDLCEVCNTGGELLMCSTCNLVFHLQCVRPKMDDVPPDSWVCAYCIMSGVKGLKQNSKMRKNAAVAVRLMARMRKQLQRQRNNKRNTETTNDEQQQQLPADEGGSDGSESSSSDAEANDKQQPQQQQPQEQPGETPSSNSVETPAAESPTTIEASASEESNEQPAAAVETTPHMKEGVEEKDDSDDKKPSPEADDQKMAAAEGEASTTEPGEEDDDDSNNSDAKEDEPADSNGEDAPMEVVDSESNKDDNDKSDSAPAPAPATADDDETPRKNNIDLAAVAAGEEEVYSHTGRVRRNRRKANYYDPQSGAASNWQSDGANEWKYLHQDGEDDEVDDVDDGSEDKGESPDPNAVASQDVGGPSAAAKKGSKKSLLGSPWCNFCKDDKSIPVCCFCACRVCFGKHDQSKLLLCDNCDSEYHLSCLSPPLKSVPSSQSWFCPSCLDAAKRANAQVGTRGSKGAVDKASSTRSSGRKSVSSKAKKAAHTKSTGKAKSPAAIEPPPVKRGPGRPRKHPLPEPYTGPPRKRGRPPKSKSFTAEPSISPPKKRGRPRKNPLPEPSVSLSKKRASPSPGPQPVKRGPGRPPKSANKKRSRSPAPKKTEEKKRAETKPRAKTSIVKEEEDFEAYDPVRATPKTSRSGRKVKRTSFHDEIDEGEQHLKSSRYAMQQRMEPGGPVAAAAEVAAHAAAAAAFVADGGIQHMAPTAPVYGSHDHHHHHDVDPHFLESIPVGGGDLSHVAHLDTLVMDPALNIDAMHVEAMQMEAAMNLNAGAEQPHVLGESMHAEEGDKKPAAVVAPTLGANVEVSNEVRPAPVVESLSAPPATILETNENPASSTVADTATPAMGDTIVPNVGVLASAPPAAASVPTADKAPKPAPAVEKVSAPAPAVKALSRKHEESAVAAMPLKREVPAVAALPSKPVVMVPAAALPPKPDVPALVANQPKSVVAVPAVAAMPRKAAAVAPAAAVTISKPVAAVPTGTAVPPKPIVTVTVATATARPPTPVDVPAVEALPQPSAIHVPAAAAVAAATHPSIEPAPVPSHGTEQKGSGPGQPAKVPRRKPGARECMQISRRFGVNVIPDKWMDVLLDYCKRGKVEHLIRMRERLDEHSRFLESQLAGLETLVQERGESDVVVPAMPEPEHEGAD